MSKLTYEEVMRHVKRCETCGNKRCADNLVAVYYDECITNDYSRWMPKYDCFEKAIEEVPTIFDDMTWEYRPHGNPMTDTEMYDLLRMKSQNIKMHMDAADVAEIAERFKVLSERHLPVKTVIHNNRAECSICGSGINGDDRYCSWCGQAVEWS